MPVKNLIVQYRKALAAGDASLARRLRAQIARETEWRWWKDEDLEDVDVGEALLEWLDIFGMEAFEALWGEEG